VSSVSSFFSYVNDAQSHEPEDLNDCCICCVYNPLCLKKIIKTDFPLLEVVTFQERIREVEFL